LESPIIRRIKSIIRRIQKEKKELLSYGDCLKTGTYNLHSAFSKAVNYTLGNRLVSVVTPEAGNGPVNLVLNKIGCISCRTLKISRNFAEINGKLFRFNEGCRYVSEISRQACDLDLLNKNMSTVSRIVVEESHAKSYSFLIDRHREKHFKSGYEKKLVERVSEGWRAISEQRYAEGARLIKGTGYGFTPGGDDFLAGLLTGFNLLAGNRNISGIKKEIYHAGRTGNVVSDSFLRLAFGGHYYERTRKFLISVTGDDEIAIRNTAHSLMSHGETSGADFATGVVCALLQLSNLSA
jgi:hypothetical protein